MRHGGRSIRRSCASVGVGLGLAVTAVTVSAPVASATSAGPPGSIVFDKGSDVWLTSPSGSSQRRVTTDGGTPTGDGTGDTGYFAPSESDSGTIVAVRNQEFDKGQPDEYTQGYLWVMDRSGNVIRTFKPAQFGYIGGGSCADPAQQLPLGITNAVVSPDGKYVAYTARTDGQSASCSAFTGYGSWIVNIDGTGAERITDANSDAASLEIGQFSADSSKLLVDRADFGSIEDFYVSVPGDGTAQAWTAPSDLIDEVYGQPDARNGLLVTEGYSEAASANAVRVWQMTDFAHEPTSECDMPSMVSSNIGETLSRPSLSPDAAEVVYEDANGAADSAGEGIYGFSAATAGQGGNACSGTTSTLLVQGGQDPFWTSASLYDPPQVSFTAVPPAVTTSRSAEVLFTATEPDPDLHILGFTCSLDGAAAGSCTSPQNFSGLADGVHTLIVTADDGKQTGSGEVSWRVDTVAPHASLTAPTASAVAATSVRVAWSGSDTGSGIARYQVRYRRAHYTGGFGRWSAPSAWQHLTGHALTAPGLAAGYDYCWSARAIDKAGNASAWSSVRCSAVALDDRSTSRSTGWSQHSGHAYYRSTVTSTSRKGASLSRTGVSADRLGVVVTTCSSCGKVAIYVGSKRIGTIDLHSSSTHRRVVKLLPVFSLRSGTVKVKVLTAGKTVAIDGLVISRT